MLIRGMIYISAHLLSGYPEAEILVQDILYWSPRNNAVKATSVRS